MDNPGVAGDLSEDCDDMEAASTTLEELFRDPFEVMDEDLSLREKRPIVADRLSEDQVWLRVQIVSGLVLVKSVQGTIVFNFHSFRRGCKGTLIWCSVLNTGYP